MTLTTLDDIATAGKIARTIASGMRRRPAIVLTQDLDGEWGVPLDEAARMFDDRVDAYAIRSTGVLCEFNRITCRPVYNGAVAAWRGGRNYLWLKERADAKDILSWCGIHGPAAPAPARPAARPRTEPTGGTAAPNACRLPDTSTWFAAPSDRWDFDIRYTWAQRTPAGEKTRRPLPDRWDYADGFDIPEEAYPVVIEGMTDALDHTDRTRPSRRLHLLRVSRMSNAPRASEYGTPIMRSRMGGDRNPWMLHYTTDEDGRVVFLNVERHDDLKDA